MRRRVHRFSRLDRSERRLTLRAMVLMGAIRLGLIVLPLEALRRLLSRPALRPSRPSGLSRSDDFARAVTRASTVVPGATCLVRALALEALLERRGYPAKLRIGFARTEGGSLSGHAWVESAGTAFGVAGDSVPHAPATEPGLGRRT